MSRNFFALSFATISIFLNIYSPACGQISTSGDNNRQVYNRDYFDKYNPQTARDLIDRLPGFTLQLGSDLRGFGGAAGNVLIDGARPSSKSGGLEEALGRIPANRIDRIEVIRSGAGVSEAAGQSVVANIILAPATPSGSWEARIQHPSDSRINVFGDITLVREIADWQTSTQIEGAIDRRPLNGMRVSSDANNQLTFFELEDSPSASNNFAASSEAQRTAFGGILRINGRFSRRFASLETERVGFIGRLPDASPDQLFTLDFERTLLNGEIGLDWARTVTGNWSVKFLSLSSYDDRISNQTASTEAPIGSFLTASKFSSDQKNFETVLRSTLSRGGEHRIRPEFGVEIAYNRLDSNLFLQVENDFGVSEISLPAANVLVEEIRGEAFANLIWNATNKLTIEAGIGGEISEISVSGDAANTQTFAFAKPSAALIYDIGSGLQIRLDARRSIGQLDFTDFAASASAADDRLLAGNPELGPDQTTRTSASVDMRTENGHALNIEIFHEWRNDILEQSLLPSGSSGLANTGSGRVWGVGVDASLPLSPIIPGGLLEAEVEFRDSTFDDPITLLSRQVSNTDSPSILVEFRQDLSKRKLAWGVSYRAPLSGTFFFTNEESLNRDGRIWSAFVETTKFFGVKTSLEFSGIGAQNFSRERRFFFPDRSDAFSGSELISRDRGMFINLALSGQF